MLPVSPLRKSERNSNLLANTWDNRGNCRLIHMLGEVCACTMMDSSTTAFGWAWLAATLALGLHVGDEATHDFLTWYNPQALRIRRFLGGFPVPPTFTFWPWLIALSLAVLTLAALTPQAYKGASWLRVLAIVMGVEHVGNGLPHLGAGLMMRRAVPGFGLLPSCSQRGIWLLHSVLSL
jgi:hypothetical protein